MGTGNDPTPLVSVALPVYNGENFIAVAIDSVLNQTVTDLELILCDNAFAFGELLDESSEDPSVHAIRAFNETVAAKAGLHGIIAPIGDGCWICVNEK